MPKTSDRSGRLGNLEHKLAAYALAGGAVVAATAGEAKAGLITTDVNQTIGTGIGQSTTYDLMIGGTTILDFSASSDGVSYAQILVTPSSTSAIVAPPADLYATNLAAGVMVSASSSFGGNGQFKILSQYLPGGQNNGNFANVSSGYLGFSFADPTVASQTDYGYVALSNSFGTTAPSATLTIDSFTYDNTGAAVIVGTTAAPSRRRLRCWRWAPRASASTWLAGGRSPPDRNRRGGRFIMTKFGSGRKLLLIGWDGADWGLLTPLLDRGMMPALDALIDRGTMARLSGLAPSLSPLLWTSIATGKRADKHGILSAIEPDLATGLRLPVSARGRKTATLWEILDAQGLAPMPSAGPPRIRPGA